MDNGSTKATPGKTGRSTDGQHYSYSFYNPGRESGQKSTISEQNRVGNKNDNSLVHKVGKCADISTATEPMSRNKLAK